MQNPENLRVSATAEDLADMVYDFTAGFPRDERFGLTSQNATGSDFRRLEHLRGLQPEGE